MRVEKLRATTSQCSSLNTKYNNERPAEKKEKTFSVSILKRNKKNRIKTIFLCFNKKKSVKN